MAITGLAVAVAAMLLAGAAHLWLRFRRAREEIARLSAGLARCEAALDSAACGFFTWSADGREHGSPGLAELVGLPAGTAPSWRTVRLALAGGDADLLDSALTELWRSGESFELAVGTRDGERVIQVSGARHRGADDYMDVVWMFDATAAGAPARRLDADRAALAAELTRLRRLLDLAPIPIWQRARDLGLVYCNRAYAAAVDMASPAAAVIEERELGASVIAEQGRALAERARRIGTPQSESHHVVIGGARRLLEFTEAPLDGTGLVAGYAQDFTDLEGVQADLGRHIDAQAEVLDHIRSGIAMFDPDRRLTFFNRGYATLWRLDPDWLRSGPDHGEILEHLRERRRLPEVADYRAWKQGRLALFHSVVGAQEEYLYLPDDTTVREIVAPHPLGGLIFIYEDVTDRLALERSYNTLTAVQRQTVSELREGVAVYGTDGRLKLGNPAFLRHWRLDPEDVEAGLHVVDLVERSRPLYRPEGSWESFKSRIVAEIMERRACTGRHVRTDGTVLDYATVPLPDGSVLYSENDVTDTYNMERALLERNEALQEADRLKTEFLANVSYELRTPLNTIIGFAEILANGYFGEMNRRQAEYCRGILDASQRLLGLVNDILDLAMVEAGQAVLELDRFDVSTMLASVLNLARERARKRNLRIVLNCAPDVGTIVADERRIKQVVFNLLSNAVKFTPPGGTVTVTARRVDNELAIQVTDTGVGIFKEDLARVFGAFERGRPGENRPVGAGLGLTLVKRFLEMHGGRVELASEPGRGTVVTCHLPTDATATAAPAPAVEGAAAP